MFRSLPFIAFQLLFLGGVIAWAAVYYAGEQSRVALPPLRETPREIPLLDHGAKKDVVISPERLRLFLSKLGLKNKGPDMVLGHIDHGFRFWGPQAVFADPTLFSGERMRQVLTDHEAFAEQYGPQALPLLESVPATGGVRFRTREGARTSSHVDHTMACLAEGGTPLDFPIRAPEGESTFRAVVEQGLRDFSLNQVEYEWSALTFALLLDADRFVSGEGQEVTFDMLADRIMRQAQPQGVCLGNHRLHALAILLRVNETFPILSASKRAEVLAYLRQATEQLVKNQHPDGFWNRDWPFNPPQSREPTDVEGDRLSDRIIATGHALEWWAETPAEWGLHPPDQTLQRAAAWLFDQATEKMTETEVQGSFSYLSHAGRALALWRGQTAWQASQ